MANPVAKSKPQTGVSDEPVKNDLYCEKCYDALNYFIDECQTMAPKLSKLKSTVSACKKDNDHYKSTLENLEFDFQEIKAQKEDYEERYNILIKSLQKTNISPKPVNESSPLPTDGNTNKTNGEQVNVTEEPQFVKDLKRKLSEKLEKLDKSVDKSEIEIEADGQVDCYKTTNVEVYNTITLDLNYLTRQFFSETKINSQKILEYFGKKILEAKESDHKRHLEIQYLPSSKKKCSESDIELRKEINDLQMQLKELKAENDKLKCQKNASPSKQDKIVDEYFALEEHESMLKKLNEQIDSLKLQLLESTADHENVVMVLNEELKVVKEKAARVDSLNLEIQDLRAENENQLLVSNENMKNRVTGYETKITDLETEISGLKSKLEAYENEKPTFQEPDVSKWREEISGLNQKITKLETDLGERDQNVQALEDQLKTLSESEQNYQNTLHSNKVLKQLNDTLIADKTNSNTAIQELEDRVDALVAEIDDLKKELTISRELLETLKSEQSEKVDLISSYEVKIVQLENQCKLYEETVVIENTGESTGVSQEQYAKLKSELEYECGVADDLKKQLQVAVDAKADAVKKCESLEDWYKANSVSTDEYTRLTEDCEVVKKTKEVTDEELRVLKEQYHAVEASLNDMKTNGSEATSQLMEERDSLTAKLAKIQSSLDLLLVEKENMVQERDRLKSQLTETTSNFENMSADMSKLMAEREDLTARTEALDTKMVEVEGERDKLKQELGSLTEVNGELSSKHQELENTLNELRASNNDSNAVMTQERDSLKASLEEMNVNLENLGMVRDDLTKQRDELKAKVSELESALERMQLELGALTEAHAKLVEEKGEVATMLAAHDQLVEQNTLLQAGNAELNEELKKWQEEVQILTDTHVAVLEEKDALEQKIVDLETDFETKRELTETLLATRKAEFQKLKEVKNEKIEGLNVKLKEKQADVDKLAETTAELEKQLAALNEELAAKTNGAAEATNKVLEYEKQTDSRVKDLEEENEKFKDDIANYKNMIDSLTTTNNMFTENLDKENQELKQKLDEQMKQSQQFIQDNFEKTKAQTERLAKLESQHNNLSIEYKNLSSMSSNDSKNYLELKQKYDAMVTQLNSLQTEKATLSKKVGESNGLYKLEVANLRTEYASVQSELTLKLKETEERLAASEEQAGQFEKDLKSTLKELSELKSELTSTQEDYEFQKNDWEARGSQQLCALSSKASKFELMYKDEVEQGQALKNKLESRLTEMNEKMGLLTEDNYKLQSLLTNKGAELKKVSAKLNKSCELIKQYEVKLAEQKNQIETSLMKFSEESKNVSAYESNYNLVAEKLKAMNEALIQEKANTGNLVSEMNSLGKEKEQLAKELLEIQRKHCAVLTEKDNLLKDLHTAKQEHEHTLKKHLSQKETLKKEVAELQTKLSEQQAKPNVSFESKMEQKMEKNIQNKLEAMVEQSHKYLNDIENYKAEIVKLKAEAVTEVEKITKSHERLCKEQKDKYNHTLKKHLTEIKKLKESAKEMTETNEFLTEQINNLNKQIYEYSNKENECDSENTTSTKPIHKRLLDLSMNTSMANKSMSDMNQLSSIDMNNRYRKNLENDDSGPSTPARMPMTPSSVSNPMTPSSTMKKQKQCAQQ